MLNMVHYTITLSVFLITSGLTRAAETHWGYPNLDHNEDFPKWGGLCDRGTRQSPINLSLKGALKGEFDELDFDNYEQKQLGVAMVNNGHTIQLSQFANEMKLEGGPLLDTYVVEQIHLHWWSEHTIDNVRYPLEAHIVHRNTRYPNMTAAANYKDGITVVGVLYHVSNHHNDAIAAIVANLDEVRDYRQVNRPTRMKKPFAVRDLFPQVDGYLTYAGSLTTPNCAESVSWIVLHESFPVSLAQVEKFKEIEYEEGKHLKNNYRNIQSNNNRPVIVVLPHEDSTRNAAAALKVSLASILLVLCLARLLA